MNSRFYFLRRTRLWQGINFFLLTICFFLFQINLVNATHIVGGQLTYRNLGNNYYEVTLVFRRDCGPDHEPFDNLAYLGVFYTNGNQKAFRIGNDGLILLKQVANDTLHETIPNVCVGKFTEVCVQQAIYRDTILLPPDERDYTLAYQRCCRNESLENIEDPLGTGSTYTAQITTTLIKGNSNPAFGVFPPIYICANKPFQFNNGATDIDGDSLVYTLCSPYKGRTMKDPAGRPTNPPYDTVAWKSPFNINNLLGSPLTIDPKTGMVSALPQLTGQFLVGVCVYEYRKFTYNKRDTFILIGYSRRDFELNVELCGQKPVAAFERSSALCDGLNVSFKNLSTDGINFIWYFDWQNNKSLTSTVFSPSFTYSKAGQYEVVLIAKNIDCVDTTRLIINVIDPKLNADFDYTVNCKQIISLQFNDKSTSNGQIVSREWVLNGPKDSLVSNLKDPAFTLKGDGKITIKLTITDENGCTATVSKMLEVNLVHIDLIADSVKICRGDSTKLVKNPNPLLNYHWDPTNGLDLGIPSDPIAHPNSTTTYTVTITDGPCSEIKQIKVIVRDRIHVSITGDTLVCNGKVDLLAKSDTITKFIWSLNPDFIPIFYMGNHLDTNIIGSKTFYVKGGTGDQCPDSTSIKVSDHSVKLKYDTVYTVCTGDTFNIQVINSNPLDTLIITWLPNPIIIKGKNTLSPTILCPTPGRYVLFFTIKNQFGCDHSDSIIINAVLPPNPEFTIENECGSLTIKVNTYNNGRISWDFGDSTATAHEKFTNHTYKKHGKYIVTLTVDSICIRSLMKEITVVELSSSLRDTVISCLGDSVYLNPGANPNYHYKWTPVTGLNDPNSPNPLATVSVSTKYFVTITDPDFPDSCFLKDSICVLIPPVLILKAAPDTILCEKTKITLRVSSNLSGTEFEWCDEFNHPIGKGAEIEVTPDSSTFYIVKAFDQYGCSARDTVHVELYVLRAFLSSGRDTICIGDTTFIKVNAGPGTHYHYVWSPKEFIIGSNTDSLIYVNPNKTTTYTVKISNDHNCDWELSKTIIVNNPKSDLHVKADPDTIVAGQKTQLTATYNSNWKYLWKPNDGSLSDSSIYNPIATPVKTTSYTVTVTDESGCSATDVVTVILKTCEESVFLPNAFSPNDDGKNDVLFLRVRDNSITKMELVIYSRWGEKVFSTTDYTIGWDGRFKDTKLPPNVYGYALKYTCHDTKEYLKKGNINLIK